jgi:membrane protein DedA with SNARE-associated domain
VFLGRWVAGLRIAAAWLAGINRMHWLTFFFWNALGGIAWSTSVGSPPTTSATPPYKSSRTPASSASQ